MNIDDNVTVEPSGRVVCTHCGTVLGESRRNPLQAVIHREQPSPAAGPGVRADAGIFTDRPIVLRQSFCPGCLVLLATEIVPGDEACFRHWHVIG
jgi:hypothetical protein